MIELFRYIEQAVVDPLQKSDPIDVEDDTDFQRNLRRHSQEGDGFDSMRKVAVGFVEAYLSNPDELPFTLRQQYLDFHSGLLQLASPNNDSVQELCKKVFDDSLDAVARSTKVTHDKRWLDDSLIAVKLVSAFDTVNATELVKMRQSIAFISELGKDTLRITSREELLKALLRPIHIPIVFLKPGNPGNQRGEIIPGENAEEKKRIEQLLKEHNDLKDTYEVIMAFKPGDLKITEIRQQDNAVIEKPKSAGHCQETNQEMPVNSSRSILTLSSETFNSLNDNVKKVLQNVGTDINDTSLTGLVSVIKSKWMDVAKEVMPYAIPKHANVYRLGIHTFAVKDAVLPEITSTGTAFDIMPAPAPDFSKAITKPVGVGNLLIVRQELLGYEAKEISHIENVMESELLRRSNRRFESSELTTIEETETTQMEERDLQSTERNELAKETQKEASNQTASTQGQTTTTDYGKLVENNKSNYAKTVTDRAVNSLTQRVRSERIQRETKTYTERATHEFDNRKVDAKKIRGIYQWVDKKYKNRIMNYGKRLLYDVVLPEPAAFLMESLKKAQQPESFQLTKPLEPAIAPSMLNTVNYRYWAQRYGVTNVVTPPPDEFSTVIAEVKTDKIKEAFSSTFYTTKLKIQDGYQAVRLYITRLNHIAYNENSLPAEQKNTANPFFEFYIGEYRTLFGSNPAPNPFLIYENKANVSVTMNEEEGELPLLFRTYSPIMEYGFAVGVECKLKDKALEKWQLKTFAAITEGYRRQLDEYEQKLAAQQNIIRAQMAQTRGYAHNPSIEQQELKKVFISLLMSEHFLQVFVPTPIPTFLPPDPVYYKKWGAMVAFFERAFEWENLMYTFYPYFWGRGLRWGELILIQDLNPQFEAFLKAGAARVVVPVRPGYEAAMAHYHETGDIWMGKEMPDMFSDLYVSIIDEIKARNYKPGDEICVEQWDVRLPTMLVMLKEDETLPEWQPSVDCKPVDE